MKVNIGEIALALFWWFPVYLDLDTGCTFNIRHETDEIVKHKNARKLPLYSRVPIYQRFLLEKQQQGKIKLGEWFNKYPVFEILPDYEPEEYNVFMVEAQDTIESFFPEYGSYLDEFMLQFAKDWCEKEGYEWYNRHEGE